MTRFGLRLPNYQARLIALAISYHLSRPGAELDPETLTDYEHGLAELLPAVDSQLEAQTVVVEVTPLQAVLLSTAISSVISELKMYSVFDTMSGESQRPRSTALGFDDRLRSLFPEVVGDPTYAGMLAEEMTMLRREIPSARAREVMEEQRQEALEAERGRKKRWQFWKRGGVQP
jgi:hypothetical protein